MRQVDQYSTADAMISATAAVLLVIAAYTAGVLVGIEIERQEQRPAVVLDTNGECLP